LLFSQLVLLTSHHIIYTSVGTEVTVYVPPLAVILSELPESIRNATAKDCYDKGPLRLHLQPPCLQTCGLNLNTDMVCDWLLTVPLLDISNLLSVGHRDLRHCATRREVAVSIPSGVNGIFHWNNPSGRTMVLGSNQGLTEMSTRNISRGVKAVSA